MFSRKILVKKFHGFSRKIVRHGRTASHVRKNKVNAKVLWSELDENLLGEIMSRLCLTDQARFRAVCKRWHSVRPITAAKSLPWFISLDHYPSIWSDSLKYRLHEPCSSLRSRISSHKISVSKLSIPYFLLSTFTVDLKHNWFVIFACLRNWPVATCHNYLYLFSPLTKAFIKLPKLSCQSLMSSSFIHTFSTNPDSPDCVFLVSNIGYKPEFVVMTCHQGDKEWTIRKFNNSLGDIAFGEYINGTFFAVSYFGQLSSYNNESGEFETKNLGRDDDLNQLFGSDMDSSMFELNGELVIMYIGFSSDHVRGDDTTFPGIPCIKKFDWPSKAWIPLRSLGDQTLFVGHRIYSIAKIGKEQARKMGVLSNAIYYYFDLGCIIYSFVNGDLVQLKYNPASENTVKSGDLLQFQYDSAIRDEDYDYYLLEPPVI